MQFTKISIIIPTLNEAGNIVGLVKRIHNCLTSHNIGYEIIFIDDHSTDNTVSVIKDFVDKYPVRFFLKKGKRGKAYSLLEGFSYARYKIVGFMDGDLQYPPEALPKMIKMLVDGGDVVVADRVEKDLSLRRRILSRTFKAVFGKLLHGLECDVQSGLKVFKKEIVERIKIDPTEWTFDLDFLLQAQNAGYEIRSITIDLDKRYYGVSKVNVFKAIWEIGIAALRSKLKETGVVPLLPYQKDHYGNGFDYKGERYIHYSDLNASESAVYSLANRQKLWLLFGGGIWILALIVNWHATIVLTIGMMVLIYFSDLIFNFFLIYRSFTKSAEIKVISEEIDELEENDLPTYTIFCPLYKEADVLPQFVAAIEDLDYPKDKLQILLLLEEDDFESVKKAYAFNLPNYFEIVVVPQGQPKTKPKACNYGLLRAIGEYCVIYDAEDIPESLQLKKVIMAFKKASNNTICIQAKLNFYNPSQNILTRLFTAEYSLWFDLVLTGLQSLNSPIPLGGTSNHFRTEKLKELGGWDAFNVTEDCDLGIRLFKKGYKTAIVDSVTLEEANSNPINWFNQRTRWIKGYIQTYLVHTRQSLLLWKKSKMDFFTFQLVIGGKVFSSLVNPFMWAASIVYFGFYNYAGAFIESLFPPLIFYIGLFTMVLGNFMYFYYYMIGAAKRKQYWIIKYVFLTPIYWLAMSLAAWIALVRFIYQPYYWFKTKHGLHFKENLNLGKFDFFEDKFALNNILKRQYQHHKESNGKV
jgi:cellulose synthase/poly-beta-1,6-N-acetylglucosamine synthase-like glycosyltransferase